MPYCGCGWPHHLLIPKGIPEGMIYDIFIMVTNGEEDAVPQLPTNNFGSTCRPAFIYCGIAGQLYPDSRPMNYPFDRLPYSVEDVVVGPNGEEFVTGPPRMVQNLADYISNIPNAAAFQVSMHQLIIKGYSIV